MITSTSRGGGVGKTKRARNARVTDYDDDYNSNNNNNFESPAKPRQEADDRGVGLQSVCAAAVCIKRPTNATAMTTTIRRRLRRRRRLHDEYNIMYDHDRWSGRNPFFIVTAHSPVKEGLAERMIKRESIVKLKHICTRIEALVSPGHWPPPTRNPAARAVCTVVLT